MKNSKKQSANSDHFIVGQILRQRSGSVNSESQLERSSRFWLSQDMPGCFANALRRSGFLLTLSIVAALAAAAWAAENLNGLNPAPPKLESQSQASPQQEHWAFKKPERPSLPQAPGLRTDNPIDLFIASALREHGLTPAPEAPPHVWLRRVYLDLIGLPPTRDQLHAFLADDRLDARERVLDELLSSPRYGERWARHWMDVWRYSDWYGRRQVPDVWNSAPQIWRWRDWIVRSLNSGKGYDRMIREMLAADELAPGDEEAGAATGFLVRNWYALNPNQWMRDNVEHTAKAFLGLTMNCAHCHDHKYDPISQKEYFQFRAFFEPLGLRQDWLAGEPDPGPFQKYDYSVLRKVVKVGSVRVFDENLEAKTHFYLGGDERNLPEDKPTVDPAVPAFLNGQPAAIQAIELPEEIFYPGLKSLVRHGERDKRAQALTKAQEEQKAAQDKLDFAQAELSSASAAHNLSVRVKATAALVAAETALALATNRTAAAQADLDALEACIAADRARFERRSEDADELAQNASRAERQHAWLRAKTQWVEADHALALLQAEQQLAAARAPLSESAKGKEAKSKQDEALKQAQERLTKTREALETAEAALRTNSVAYTPLGPVYPKTSSGRRRALAEWMTSQDHPLTARVAVNHIWARHFHAPLVSSVFDFGRNGSPPTHPELLDWLAVEFMASGWSMKHLHRLIATSEAYRRVSFAGASGQSRANAQIDPENRWLWRMNPGRMEAEVLRDSMLHLAGTLDPRMGGYPLANTNSLVSHRRSLYFECHPEAGGHGEFTAIFDPPDPGECYRRAQTVVPQQALALSNSEWSHRLGERAALQIARDLTHLRRSRREEALTLDSKAVDSDSETQHQAFIQCAFEQILGRAPSAEELSACGQFLVKQAALFTSEKPETSEPPKADTKAVELDPELRAKRSLVHALFNHNDFVTIR